MRSAKRGQLQMSCDRSSRLIRAMDIEFDLVCGKPVTSGPRIPAVAIGPWRFVFCSDACRDRFVALPVFYLRRAWARRLADRLASEQFVPQGGRNKC